MLHWGRTVQFNLANFSLRRWNILPQTVSFACKRTKFARLCYQKSVGAVAEEWKLLMQVGLILYIWRTGMWICDINRHQHDVQHFGTTGEEVTFSSHPDAFKFSTKFLDASVSASAQAWKYDSAFTDDDMFQSSSFSIHLGFAKLSFPSAAPLELSSGRFFHWFLLQKQEKQKVCLLTCLLGFIWSPLCYRKEIL